MHLKTRLPLFLILIIFIALKIPHLSLAYYWDESIPYAPAIKAMYAHGPSLLPGALDPDLSHGHPLFFHAAFATWMKLFGTSHIALHSFALLLSVALLVIIYESALRYFNLRTAILALLLTTTQVIFFVQSSVVIPEIMVALLCFSSIILYASERYLLAGILLTLLFFTKESGLVLGVVLGIHAAITLFSNKAPLRQRIARLLSVAIPFILIAAFFMDQKMIRGWYFYPMHIDLIRPTWNDFWYVFRLSPIRTAFHDQLRYYVFSFLLFCAIIVSVKQKKLWPLAILLPATCLYYFVDDMRAGRLMPSIPFFITFLISIAIFLVAYLRSKMFADSIQRRIVLLFCLFTIAFCLFSAMNFFTPRYMLAAIIPMLFVVAALIDRLSTLSFNWLYYPAILLVAVVSIFAFKESKDDRGDTELGSYDALATHQAVVGYFEQNVPYDTHVSSAEYLEEQHLKDPATGFLRSDRSYKCKWAIDDSTQYVVSDNIETDTRYENFKKDTSFYLVKRIEKGKLWAEIYKRH